MIHSVKTGLRLRYHGNGSLKSYIFNDINFKLGQTEGFDFLAFFKSKLFHTIV